MKASKLAIICALPVLAILFIQIAYRKYNEPINISGCYRSDEVSFEIKDTDFYTSSNQIARAYVKYFKQEPYLVVDPGIDIIPLPSPRIVIKGHHFPEHYPIVLESGRFAVSVISSDNRQYVFNRLPCEGN